MRSHWCVAAVFIPARKLVRGDKYIRARKLVRGSIDLMYVTTERDYNLHAEDIRAINFFCMEIAFIYDEQHYSSTGHVQRAPRGVKRVYKK